MVYIDVYKSKRILYVVENQKIIKMCRVGLGPSPHGKKVEEGDGKTPEGTYYICTRNPRSKYTLFLGISYPGANDAQDAYRHKKISKQQLIAIEGAHAAGKRPPWDTPLGGEIGIHGGGVKEGGRITDNTAGCIAVLDADISEIWRLAGYGTTVYIYP